MSADDPGALVLETCGTHRATRSSGARNPALATGSSDRRMIYMAFSRSASNEAGDDQRRDDAKNAAVARLQQVEATGIPCASLRDLIGSEDIPLAYLVQEQIVSARVTDNNGRVERKIGLTSPAVQAQLKVDQPDFGTLLHDMLVTQAEPVANDRLLQPRIEAEIAFALGADIDDLAPSLGTIAASIQFARPAFEIVDSRIAGWDIDCRHRRRQRFQRAFRTRQCRGISVRLRPCRGRDHNDPGRRDCVVRQRYSLPR